MAIFSTNGFIILSLLLFTFLISAAATITCRQIPCLLKAVSSQRSVYKKRAIQALELAFVLYTFLFFITAIDVGFANILFRSLEGTVYTIIVFLPIFLSFSLFLVRYWFRALKSSDTTSVSWLWASTSAFTSLKSIGLMAITTYASLYIEPSITIAEEISENAPIQDPYVVFLTNIVQDIYIPMFSNPLQCIYILSFFVLAGLCLGYSLQILYTLICRNNDDYGRDFYNASIKDYSKHSYYATSVLCLLVLAGIFGNIIPFAQNTTALTIILFPIALILYFLIMRSANPLRFKISIALCPILLLIASVFFIVQSLYI